MCPPSVATFSAYDGTTTVPFPPERRGVMIVATDLPDHSRVRRLISAGFTPRMIGRLEEQIRVRTERILDDAAARGELDFVPDIAYQLPMHVTADIVGIPEADRGEVFQFTEVIMRAADDVWSILATGGLDVLTQGLVALLENSDQLADLRENLELLTTAVEEVFADLRCLRWRRAALLPRRQPRPVRAQDDDRRAVASFQLNRDHRRTDLDERRPAATVGVAIQSLPVRLG